MLPHMEIESTRSTVLEAGQRFWGWEIPVYLFLGGLVAGLMLTVCVIILLRGREAVTPAMRLGLVGAPILLSLGMGALFLDLTLKTHVFRFYLTVRPYAPMSLGSWVLLLVYPVQGLLVLALPWEPLQRHLDRFAVVKSVQAWAEKQLKRLAWVGLFGGLSLGIYTGVLLSTTVAAPLWSSGALGFLFLASGLSTGVAALMLVEKDHASQNRLAKADVALIGLELLLIGGWIVGLATQGPIYRQAVSVILSGSYAPVFVGFVLFGGLLVPGVLEALSINGKAKHSKAVPALVLVGGLLLRFVVVYAGQEVTFYQA
jgi:formate-dependent nitrite reductase membrane component NrfD